MPGSNYQECDCVTATGRVWAAMLEWLRTLNFMKDQVCELLREAIAAFEPHRHLSVRQAALQLDCSPKYIRKHLMLFPNVWRMEGGDIRIPARDIDAMIAQRKIHKAVTVTS